MLVKIQSFCINFTLIKIYFYYYYIQLLIIFSNSNAYICNYNHLLFHYMYEKNNYINKNINNLLTEAPLKIVIIE